MPQQDSIQVRQSNGDDEIIFNKNQFSKTNNLLTKILSRIRPKSEEVFRLISRVGDNEEGIHSSLRDVRAKQPTAYGLYRQQIHNTLDTVKELLDVNDQLSEERKGKINQLKTLLHNNLNNNNIYFVQRITGMLLQLLQFQMSDTDTQGFDKILKSVFTVVCQDSISKKIQDKYIQNCQIKVNEIFLQHLKKGNIEFYKKSNELFNNEKDTTNLHQSYYDCLDKKNKFHKIQQDLKEGLGIITDFYNNNFSNQGGTLEDLYQQYLKCHENSRHTMDFGKFVSGYEKMKKFVNSILKLYRIQIENIAELGPDQVEILETNLNSLNHYKTFIEREHGCLKNNRQVRVLGSNAPKLPDKNDYLDSIRQCVQHGNFIANLFNKNRNFFVQIGMNDFIREGHQQIASGVGKLKQWNNEQNQQLLPDMKQAQDVESKTNAFFCAVVVRIVDFFREYVKDDRRLLEVLDGENDTIVPNRKPVRMASLFEEVKKEKKLPSELQTFLCSEEFKKVLDRYSNQFDQNSVSYEQYCNNNPSKQERIDNLNARLLSNYNQSQYQKPQPNCKQPQPNYKQQQYRVGGDTIKVGRSRC